MSNKYETLNMYLHFARKMHILVFKFWKETFAIKI